MSGLLCHTTSRAIDPWKYSFRHHFCHFRKLSRALILFQFWQRCFSNNGIAQKLECLYRIEWLNVTNVWKFRPKLLYSPHLQVVHGLDGPHTPISVSLRVIFFGNTIMFMYGPYGIRQCNRIFSKRLVHSLLIFLILFQLWYYSSLHVPNNRIW